MAALSGGPVVPKNSFRPWLSAGSALQPDPTVAAVGVRTIVTKDCRVFRVFYPAEYVAAKAKPTSWFRVPLESIVDGYLHAYAGGISKTLRKGGLFFEALSWITRSFVSWMSLRNAKLPFCYDDLKPRRNAKIPLVMWSHGLTGTNDEYALVATALAADCNVVALVHHCDGSSSKVDFGPTGPAPLYFQHPDFKNYDRTMRQRQAEHRASEIEAVRALLLEGAAGEDLRDLIDPQRVAVGGFSFGATTAALVAATNPASYRCAVLVDGWFHIELNKRNVHLDIPSQAHERGLPLPSLFLGSAEFAGYKALADATARLHAQAAAGSESRRVPGTRHHNFADLVWWLWAPVLRAAGLGGGADSFTAYRDIVVQIRDFLRVHCR